VFGGHLIFVNIPPRNEEGPSRPLFRGESIIGIRDLTPYL